MKKKFNFAVIGGSGYVAEKHYISIKKTGNTIIAVYDPVDNIGVLDKYEITSLYFNNFEKFKKFIRNSKGTSKQIDYLTICSPNYLHFQHIQLGLKNNLKIICEKPLLINITHLNFLLKKQKKQTLNINLILQLRFHPVYKELSNFIKHNPRKKYKVNLNYLAPRGNWYLKSWKSNSSKSGGIASNIGIHLFDILICIFGKVLNYKVYYRSTKTMIGYLELENAEIDWILSTDYLLSNSNKPIRKIKLLKKEFNLSASATDLHHISYNNILNNKGFTINESIDSLKLVNKLKKIKIFKKSPFTEFNNIKINAIK
ncbi:Gfo/Idh/MocA family oxidoreductase [Alphaproteobacteria bacterium]|nr:Gfo/Idh/MocA family oxidoreductase [Alphaproteobacteria bacterium]